MSVHRDRREHVNTACLGWEQHTNGNYEPRPHTDFKNKKVFLQAKEV